MLTEAIFGADDIKVGDTIFIRQSKDDLNCHPDMYQYLVTGIEAEKIFVTYWRDALPDIRNDSFISTRNIPGLYWGRILDVVPYDPAQEPDDEDDV